MSQPQTVERVRSPEVYVGSPETEEYSRSLIAIRELGHTMLAETVDAETVAMAERPVAANFNVALEENLNTDPEFGMELDIDKEPQRFAMIDGHAVAPNGDKVVALIERGIATSSEAAKKDSRYLEQKGRDVHDRGNALEVDAMPVGTGRLVVTMDPKRGLMRHKKFWEDLGYRDGMVFIQWYAKEETEDGEAVVASVISVDDSDLDTWRELFAEEGVVIPEDEHPNDWIRNAITGEMTAEEARQRARDLRDRYYAKRGQTKPRLSVSEYIASQQETIQTLFEVYGRSHAMATASGKKNDVMHGLAQSLLQNAAHAMKPQMRHRLIQICNSEKFDAASALFMHEAIRYAVVEELRKGLHREHGKVVARTAAPRWAGRSRQLTAEDVDALHYQLAQNVLSGASAGRSYGGCSGQFDPGAGDLYSMLRIPQGIYGGNMVLAGEDQWGSLVFICDNGHLNTREHGQKIPRCQDSDCTAKVKC